MNKYVLLDGIYYGNLHSGHPDEDSLIIITIYGLKENPFRSECLKWPPRNTIISP